MKVAQTSIANALSGQDAVRPTAPVSLADDRCAPSPSAALLYQQMIEASLQPADPRYAPPVRLAIILTTGAAVWAALIVTARVIAHAVG